MVDSYKILYKGGSGELVEKKSRFIADLCPVSSEEEALDFIEEIRQAVHGCQGRIDKGVVEGQSVCFDIRPEVGHVQG